MDESEKRKERLKAMCLEAEKPEIDGQKPLDPSGHLINPLAHGNTSSPAYESPASFPRFDYYTDPMSAFSGSKIRSNAASVNMPLAYSTSPGARLPSHLAGPRNASPAPFPAPAPSPHQFQMNSSPYPVSYRMQSPMMHSTRQLSPCGMTSPFSTHSPCAPNMQKISPGPLEFGSRPQITRGGFMSPHGRGTHHSNSGRSSQGTNSGRGGYNSRFADSPSRFSYNSGSSGFRNSPGCSGRGSSGWRRGAPEPASALQAPELFYSKVMMQDPWNTLAPVVGSIMSRLATPTQKTPVQQSSWLPPSIASKKAKTGETGKALPTRSSLAEYLALSFEEAVNDESDI